MRITSETTSQLPVPIGVNFMFTFSGGNKTLQIAGPSNRREVDRVLTPLSIKHSS